MKEKNWERKTRKGRWKWYIGKFSENCTSLKPSAIWKTFQINTWSRAVQILNCLRVRPQLFRLAKTSKICKNFKDTLVLGWSRQMSENSCWTIAGFSVLRPWQTRTHCCGYIVADTNVSPFARARNICCGHKFCVRDTKNVTDFVQKHVVTATNVSQFAQPKKHHGQQCVRNKVSSFARALRGYKST